jgi:hypothetical protein
MILETENFATMNGFDIVERVGCRLSCYKFGMLNLATTISQKLRLSIHSCYRFFPEHFVSFLESHGTIILKGKERRCHEIREFGICNGTF